MNAVDKKERRALHYAAYMGHTEIMTALITNGADLNAKDRKVEINITGDLYLFIFFLFFFLALYSASLCRRWRTASRFETPTGVGSRGTYGISY